MKKRGKIIAVLALVLCGALLFLFAAGGQTQEGNLFERTKRTIRLWYSDDALTDYLTAKAVEFNGTHDDARVEPALVSGVELLENISQASLEGETFPDLYITTNDVLEKAQLAGLAAEIPKNDRLMNAVYFPETALNAVTYDGRYVAYPFYFETSTLMYNRTYLEALARDSLENEKAERHPEAVSGDPVLQVSDEEVTLHVEDMIPSSIADILSFASAYSLPGEVEAVFKWDVTDIFYNYFFVGEYMNAGGPAGDSITSLDLYNSEMVGCLKAYQKLNTYFAIDASDVDYDKIVDDFIAGKMVFTVVTSDAVTRIREAQEAGECDFVYGVADIPWLNSYYATRTMSVTDCIVINGYCDVPDIAMEFARVCVAGTDENFFRQTGKLSARSGITYEDEGLSVFFRVYANSVPLPKMMETSNLWMRLEIAFTMIWNGADCNRTLKDMSEGMMKQVVGRHYEEMLLPEPEAVSISDDSNND